MPETVAPAVLKVSKPSAPRSRGPVKAFKPSLLLVLLAVMLAGPARADNTANYAAQQLKNLPLSAAPFGGATTTAGSPANGATAVSATGHASVSLTCAAGGAVTDADVSAHPMGYSVQCVAASGGYTLNVCAPDDNPADCAQTPATPGTAAAVTVSGDAATLTLSACTTRQFNTVCTLAFSVSHRYSGSPDALTAQGQAAASQQAGVSGSALSLVNSTGVIDPTTGNIVAVGSSATQTARMSTSERTTAQTSATCFNTQHLALQNGKAVYTCDGVQSVKFNTGDTCTPGTECVAWSTQIDHYNQTCTANVTFTHHSCDVVTTPSVTYTTGCTPGQTYTGPAVEVSYVQYGGGRAYGLLTAAATCPAAGATTLPIHLHAQWCYENNCSGRNFNGASDADINLPLSELTPTSAFTAGQVYQTSSNGCRTIAASGSPLPLSSNLSDPADAVMTASPFHAGGDAMPVLFSGMTCSGTTCTGTWGVVFDQNWNYSGAYGGGPGPTTVWLVNHNANNADTACPAGQTLPAWPLSSGANQVTPYTFTFGIPSLPKAGPSTVTDGCATYEAGP